jgi:hypothetical protein
MSDVVTIGINNLFQSFDPVRKNAGECLDRESSQNFLNNFTKLIDLGNGSRSELAFQSINQLINQSKKEIRWCNIRTEMWMRDAFELQFFHSGQISF